MTEASSLACIGGYMPFTWFENLGQDMQISAGLQVADVHDESYGRASKQLMRLSTHHSADHPCNLSIPNKKLLGDAMLEMWMPGTHLRSSRGFQLWEPGHRGS